MAETDDASCVPTYHMNSFNDLNDKVIGKDSDSDPPNNPESDPKSNETARYEMLLSVLLLNPFLEFLGLNDVIQLFMDVRKQIDDADYSDREHNKIRRYKRVQRNHTWRAVALFIIGLINAFDTVVDLVTGAVVILKVDECDVSGSEALLLLIMTLVAGFVRNTYGKVQHKDQGDDDYNTYMRMIHIVRMESLVFVIEDGASILFMASRKCPLTWLDKTSLYLTLFSSIQLLLSIIVLTINGLKTSYDFRKGRIFFFILYPLFYGFQLYIIIEKLNLFSPSKDREIDDNFIQQVFIVYWCGVVILPLLTFASTISGLELKKKDTKSQPDSTSTRRFGLMVSVILFVVYAGIGIGIVLRIYQPFATTIKCTTTMQCKFFSDKKNYCFSSNNCPDGTDQDEVAGEGNNFHECIVSVASSPVYNLSIDGIYHNNTPFSNSACLGDDDPSSMSPSSNTNIRATDNTAVNNTVESVITATATTDISEFSDDATATPTDPPTSYYGKDVSFSEFVEHTSRTIPTGAGINGLYLTLGNSVDDNDNNDDLSTEEEEGSCVIGNEVITGTVRNIMHTIEPVFYNKKTNPTPSITVSSYPDNLIQTIVFGQDKVGGYHKFLRLKYNEDMLKKIIENSNNETSHYYGVWIQFPSDELEEVHIGGDLIVEMKEGFTNTSLVRATDRTKVDVSYDGDNTIYVQSSQQSRMTLDVGHHDDLTDYVQSDDEKIRALASGSSIMKISGTVERIECDQNATCIVDGTIISEECNDSIVAMNATLETDDCSCVVVVNPTAPVTQLITNGTITDSDGNSITASSQAISLSFDNNVNPTASCTDTTFIPTVVADTDGPSTTNKAFSCPADIMTVPLFTPSVPQPPPTTEKEYIKISTTTSTTAGEEEYDMSNTMTTGDINNTTTTNNSSTNKINTGEDKDDEEEEGTDGNSQDTINILWENDNSSASPLLVPAMTMVIIMVMTLSIVCLLVQELLYVVEE